jgi:tetratricopeptide (TPR) repeat protein
MQLADTLDKLHQYDESLKLREQVCNIQLEKGADADKLYESFDFWAWTCWKAYLDSSDEARKQSLLEKANELSQRTLKFRPGARRTLERWSGLARELGDQEYNRAKLAEVENQPVLAKQHAVAALKHYENLAAISRQLAVAPDMMYSLSNYGRSFYALGLMQKNFGKRDEARASFANSRHVREQVLRDFAGHQYVTHLQIDLLFTRVAQGEHAQAVSAADAMRREPLFNPAVAQSLLY